MCRQVLTAILACGLLSLGPARAGPRKPNADAKSSGRMELAWPAPPEQPRVRYVMTISSTEDVTGRFKPSLVERLSGRSPARDQLRLLKPYGVAVDKGGRVFVADPAQRAILIYDLQARTATRLRGNAQLPLFLPIALAFDGGGRLYVSDSFAAQVVVFEPGGKPIAGFGKGVLKRPGGIVADPQRGRIYVADAKLNKIFLFSLSDGKLLKSFGGSSKPGAPEPGRFSAPTNLALDSKGRLYVVDTWNCRVQVFDPEGKFLRVFGTQGIQPGRFVRPKGIAVDSQDHVYVADAEFNNFQVFSPEGKPLLFIGSIGDGPGQFLLPAGLAIDREDRIYVTEQRLEFGRLQIFQYLADRTRTSAGAKGR